MRVNDSIVIVDLFTLFCMNGLKEDIESCGASMCSLCKCNKVKNNLFYPEIVLKSVFKQRGYGTLRFFNRRCFINRITSANNKWESPFFVYFHQIFLKGEDKKIINSPRLFKSKTLCLLSFKKIYQLNKPLALELLNSEAIILFNFQGKIKYNIYAQRLRGFGTSRNPFQFELRLA